MSFGATLPVRLPRLLLAVQNGWLAKGEQLTTVAGAGLDGLLLRVTPDNAAALRWSPTGGRSAGFPSSTRRQPWRRSTSWSRSTAPVPRSPPCSRINAERQQALGIDRYIWRSRDDALARPLHSCLDDGIFFWDEPPEGGHPGEACSCRCFAEPVLLDEPDWRPTVDGSYRRAIDRAILEGAFDAAVDFVSDFVPSVDDLWALLEALAKLAEVAGEAAELATLVVRDGLVGLDGSERAPPRRADRGCRGVGARTWQGAARCVGAGVRILVLEQVRRGLIEQAADEIPQVLGCDIHHLPHTLLSSFLDGALCRAREHLACPLQQPALDHRRF